MWFPIKLFFGTGALGILLLAVVVFAATQNKSTQNLEVIPLMTYKSAIEYFVTNRPSSLTVKKAAMLKEDHPQGYLVSQVFLDENNEIVCQPNGIPYGRKAIVQSFDEELADAFRGKDMIVIT